ncbi:MAG: hypothetical protein ACW99Q_25415, partial [Candidatus Kariarchaeaceae archaeon]
SNLLLLIFISAVGTILLGFFKSLLYLDVLGVIFLFIAFYVTIYLFAKIRSVIFSNYKPIFPEFKEDGQLVVNNE